MEVIVSQVGEYSVVSLNGRLDATTAAAFDVEARKIQDAGKTKIVVDMAGLEFVSSAGLRSLLTLAKAVRPAGEVRFACVRPAVKDVLAISGFTSIFKMFSSVEEAAG
jgi:anti-anti-sigma factor